MQVRESFSPRPRLRAAQVTQIPLRTGDLRVRGQHLCESGWDINAALLLAEDAEALASTCRMLGEVASAVRLESFAENLWALLDPPIVPDAQMLDEFSRRLDMLDAENVEDPDSKLIAEDYSRGLFGYAVSEDNGFPLLVRPPPSYWQRFASLQTPERIGAQRALHPEPLLELDPQPAPPPADEISTPAPVSADSATLLVEPVDAEASVETPPPMALEAETVAAPVSSGSIESSARQACHLHDGSELAIALDLQLEQLGYELVHLDGIDGLKDWLSRSTPALVMLDGEYQPYIEEIGALVRAARGRSEQRILLIAHGGEKSDLAARLRAMRAGCDAFVVQPENAEAVIHRLRELTQNAEAEPFRIMIVEDDRSQAFFAESILRKNGMQTLAVSEASAVLDKLDEFAPDLVLMDLNMPVCNGIELTALIREREAYISMPIVFLSGEGDTDKHFEALSAGGDDFLSKPIAPRHLITAVTSRVRRARQLARRRAPAVREPAAKRELDVAQISARLTELLAMEDATTRNGGILFIALESAGEMRERLGASASTSLITELSALLERQLGRNDLLSRSGESDFLLLNPDRALASLEEFAEQLRKSVVDHEFESVAADNEVRVAIGVCPFAKAAGDARAMIEAAEQALLDRVAASEGEASAELASIETDAKPARAEAITESIEAALRKALRDSSFQLVFQPIVSLHGEEERQFQALLRLSNDAGRVYSASELIPAAEAAQLIDQVDLWVLDSCLGTIAENLRGGDNVRLFVTQSASSVHDTDRVDWTREALESRRIPAALLTIDLRMQDATAHLASYIGFALAMKQLGVSLSLSGIEAGKQATEMLMHLPVDYIKLAPRYTSDHGDKDLAELRDLVKLAHASGRRVIAPRVEEARVAASLWSCGIDLIQGNFVQQATRDANYDFHAAHA